MKYCENCGFQMFDRETKCPNCGQSDGTGKGKRKSSTDVVSVGWIILVLLIPIAGIILWAVKKNEQPSAARTYLIVGIVLWVINFILLNQLMKMNGSDLGSVQNQNQYEMSL